MALGNDRRRRNAGWRIGDNRVTLYAHAGSEDGVVDGPGEALVAPTARALRALITPSEMQRAKASRPRIP